MSQGEHLHMEVATVNSKSTPYWNSSGIGIRNAIHMWNALYVDNTVLLRPENYNWREYGSVPPLPPYNKGDFIPTWLNINNTKRKEVNLWRV